MSKVKTIFACQQCGYQSAKWLGRCPDCNSWNTLVEETQVQEASTLRSQFSNAQPPRSLLDVEAGEQIRQSTKIEEQG